MNADDRFQRKPLYEAVVIKARELGLAGASVFPTEMGIGCHRVVHDGLEPTLTLVANSIPHSRGRL